jgi:hypothetical protein
LWTAVINGVVAAPLMIMTMQPKVIGAFTLRRGL